MIDAHPCPQCGEMLEVPPTMLGQPVRCAACSRVFTPEEPTLAAEFDAPRRARRRRRDFEESDGSSRRPVYIVLGIFAVLGLLCCGGLSFFVYSTMHPKWQPYDSQAGEFTAKFPGPVEPSSMATGRTLRNAIPENAQGVVATRGMLAEEFFVYFVPLTVAELRKPEKLLAEFADGVAAQVPGSFDFRQRISHKVAGYDAMDIVLDLGDDRFTQARILLANEKAYIIGVTGPMKPDDAPWVQEFLDGFRPKDAANPGAKPGNGKNPFRGK